MDGEEGREVREAERMDGEEGREVREAERMEEN